MTLTKKETKPHHILRCLSPTGDSQNKGLQSRIVSCNDLKEIKKRDSLTCSACALSNLRGLTTQHL